MDKTAISTRLSVLIGIIHIGVGIAIVTISSFVNSEMKLANWNTSQISIFLGIPILFELSRLFFAYVYDKKGIIRSSLIIGLVISSIGIFLIPSSIVPIGNFTIIIAVSMFYFGSSIMTTLVDANLTLSSTKEERSKIAGIIQILRLSGFAIGGILGSILYSRLSFSLFINLIISFYVILGIVSIYSVISTSEAEMRYENLESVENNNSTNLENQPSGKLIIFLMSLFLFLYPIGLFMQDLILEPFAIDQFNFDKDNVGQIVAVWTTLTLIFVPLGVWFDRKTSRIIPITVGELLSIAGLLFFAISTIINSIIIFYIGLVLFGIGNGIASAPAIGMMLEVSATYPKQLAFLLGIFGIMTTIGRSLAAIIAGFILELSNDSYFTLFVVESIVVLIGLLPLLVVNNKLNEIEVEIDLVDPLMVTSIDLN